MLKLVNTMGTRDFRKEAAKEAVSFLYDNYRHVVFTEDFRPGVDFYKLRHVVNGNTITILASETGYTVKKNRTIVKQEP